jgi:hypothetical protein
MKYMKEGYDTRILVGGVNAWKDAGYPANEEA